MSESKTSLRNFTAMKLITSKRLARIGKNVTRK